MASVQLVASGVRAQESLPGSAFQNWHFPDGTPWASFWRVDEHYLVRFPELVDFEVSADGQTVGMWRCPGVSAATAENLYLNQAVPLALSRQGALVLHASGVEFAGRCVAFAGPSGRGKSTLAAAFALRGHALLCDDALEVVQEEGRLLARPGHPSVRLWADSEGRLVPQGTARAEQPDYTSKARLLEGPQLRFRTEAAPLAALFFLGEGEAETARIEPVPAAAATIELLKHSFVLDVEERTLLATHFEQVAQLARQGMCWRLDFPRRFESLAQTLDTVTEVAATLPS